MRKFFGTVLAMLLALIIFSFLFLFVAGAIIGGLSVQKTLVEVKNPSVLYLDVTKKILEKEVENPFEDFDLPISSNKGGQGLIEMVKAISYAKSDDRIKGIYLNSAEFGAGIATAEEIRNALLDFKNSGKFIYAYAETYSEVGYYVASIADRIFLHPAGLLELNGYAYRTLFLKGAFDKLDIKPEIFKVGNYKSAVEPFTLDKMSDYNREQTLSYLNSMNTHMLANVAAARQLSYPKAKLISDSMLVRNPADAKTLGIITDIGYYDEFLDALRNAMGLGENEKINTIAYAKYKYAVSEPENNSINKIAVIVAQGDINTGKSDEETIGSDDMAAEIRKARLDSSIKAVVLRVNSPGGSALASDVMWREVVLTAKKKPIIASMSDVAASGGYYLAMGCTKIVAQPNSITGSIGVFGLLFNIKNFLKNKLGITTDGVKTGNFSDIGNPTRDLTPYERQAIQAEVQKIYDDFVAKAADGRKMTVDKLDKLASGRVWSGIEAQQNGLVDTLGGLQVAIALAAKHAELDSNYKVVYMPETKKFLDKIISDIQKDNEARIMARHLGEYSAWAQTLHKLKSWEGIQARLPEVWAIK